MWSDDSIYPYIIDSYKCGNETRFINCYVNISTEPNVIFKSVNVDGNPRIFLLAKKDIEIGEELLSDYGKNYCKKFNIIKIRNIDESKITYQRICFCFSKSFLK